MKIIAIDTAATACSAAVCDENKSLLACFEAATGRKHSQDFMPGVEQMLKQAELRLCDMDAIAVTVGPGSFTGIRIGLATAKAWGFALQKPLIPIITLDALAYGVEGLCCPILDARRNEVYTAFYRDGRALSAPRAIAPQVLFEELRACHDPVCFCGDAVSVYEELFSRLEGYNVIELPQRLFMARSAACLGIDAFMQGKYTSAAELDAFYLRGSEAEEKRLKNG